MDKNEKLAISLAAMTVSLFGIAIVFAAVTKDINVPGCVTDVKPFDKGQLVVHAPNRVELHVLARMWSFEPGDLEIAPGTTVDFYLSSKDVVHGFMIERTNINLMAVPGAVNYARAEFTEPGTYHVVCHEFCGNGHHNMMSKIVVREGASPQIIAGSGEVPGAVGLSDADKSLLQAKTCLACHSVDGSPSVGPTFKGLFGRTETLVDGTTRVVDEAFLRESIAEPSKTVIKGFPPSMPKLPLSEQETTQIVEALKKL